MQAIIEGNLYEVEPAVKVIIDKLMIENNELKKENERLEEKYQKATGVIAATDCAECKKDNEPVKHGELLAKIKDLIAKYKQAESGMIWESSGSIEEDEKKLEIECKELRKYFEKALGGAE